MKKIVSFFICLMVAVITAVPCFALGTIESVDAPYGVKYAVHNDGDNERISVSCMLTDEFARLTAYPDAGINYSVGFIQLDYRIDGGEWQYISSWDTDPEASDYGTVLDCGDTVRLLDMMYLVNQTSVEDAGVLVKTLDDGSKVFDLENHSLEVRLRSGVAYRSTGSYITVSEWTQTVKIERKAQQEELPTEFEAPGLSNLQVLYSDNEMPYLSFDVKTPESIKLAQSKYQAYEANSFQLKCFVDYGEGWKDVSMSSSGGYLSSENKKVYLNEAVFDDEKTVKLMLQYLIYGEGDVPLYSEESETLKVTVPRWEEGKGLLHARCTTCGICKPIFGVCMFVVFGIAAAVIVVAAVIIKIRIDKLRLRQAEQEEERQRRIQAEKAAYNAKKQANKEKSKKK